MTSGDIKVYKGPKRRWALRLASIGLIVLVVAVIEVSLRIVPPEFLAGDNEKKLNPIGLPYFQIEKKDGYQVYTPSRYYSPWGHHFQFIMPKPGGVFRIFTLGGSTPQGYPFFNPGAFSKWLSIMLHSGIDDHIDFEVINSSQQGFPISEVITLERQILKADPDLIIIYSGNNEFFFHRGQPPHTESATLPVWVLKLKYRLQQFQIIRLIQHYLDKVSSDKPEFGLEPDAVWEHAAYFLTRNIDNTWDRDHHDRILSQYRSDLESMVEMAQQQGIGVILCTVAVNLRDYEPYDSYHRDGLSDSALAQWSALVDSGKSAFSENDFILARNLFRKATAVDDTPARLNFYMGHTLLRLGEKDEAYRYFLKAADNDAVRDRAGADINDMIREMAKAHNAALADTESQFLERTKNGVPGDDLFLDAVHPTLEGHRIIAETILGAMVDRGWARPRPGWGERARMAATSYEEKIPAQYLYNSYYTAASINSFMGQFSRARFWVNKALQHKPNQPAGLELKYCLESILQQRTTDPSLPWGEVEFVRTYNNKPEP